MGTDAVHGTSHSSSCVVSCAAIVIVGVGGVDVVRIVEEAVVENGEVEALVLEGVVEDGVVEVLVLEDFV